MTPIESTTAPPELAEVVRQKVLDAPNPLKLKEVVTGLKRPKKTTAGEYQTEIRTLLEGEVRLGRVFSYPSAKGQEPRYWAKDEKHLLRQKALDLAAQPQSISALKKELGKAVKGADGAFVETVIRDLIAEEALHEYPAKTKKGGPLFGSSPAPPPLEQAKHQTALGKLARECEKLLGATGATVEALFTALRSRLTGETAKEKERGEVSPLPLDVGASPTPETPSAPEAALQELILKAVANAPVVSLADLRREMPKEYRGPAFDAAVLLLADDEKVIVSQDADPSRFSESERAEYVQDGGVVFTTVSKRS